jgi:hypothetical protein
MAEKGGTKTITVITICIMLITIGFSGCIGDDEDKVVDEEIPNAELGDLGMTISSDNDIYFTNSKHINISIEIKNIANYSVKIYEWYKKYIEISITSPKNQTYIADYRYFFANLTHVPKKIEIKSNDFVKFNMDIKDPHKSNINWNITGIYILEGNYDDIVNSNFLSININK